MIEFNKYQDAAAREWSAPFDYRAIRNGVQVGNIKMHEFDKVNLRAIELAIAPLLKVCVKQKALMDEAGLIDEDLNSAINNAVEIKLLTTPIQE